MPKFKGTGIVVLEKLLNQKSPDAFQEFKEDLTVEERSVYDQTMPISWVPVEIAAKLSEKVAHILYSEDPDASMKLGMARANEHVNGVYRIIMKMISVNTVLERSAKLWRWKSTWE